ncbi:MAG: kinase [Thermoplasmataceae archaeon]|jgi:D-glycero-alpha-D-manno-heptose-7-phosphate kinase|nr:MAG: hypothetical protein AMDU2_EPLC00007G0063 [Thermoplasmatales archaeon E-plasma]
MKDRMFISKTPLRITFVGGGSDIKEYYSKYGRGSVLSAAINKFIYIVVNKKFDSKIRVSYSKTEIVDSVNKIEHPSVREALKLLEIEGGIEIVSISDIPSGGTGLGSSSTFLVGLLNALHAWKGEFVSPKELAEEAVKIEREILCEPGGKQDQYMAAYGGIQQLEFYADEKVGVRPVISSTETIRNFERSLLLLYTGIQRSSTDIHKVQMQRVEKTSVNYEKMVQMADEAFACLNNGNYESIGRMIHENWILKKSLSEGVSNGNIDVWYEKALKKGALGGKIIGAGGGGFMLFMADPSKHNEIMQSLPELTRQEFSFESEGSRIIYVGD